MVEATQAGGRPPAPGELELVRRFANTRDVEEGTDELSEPAALRCWLRREGLPGGDRRVDEAGLARVIEAREAIRSLALANGGEPADPAARATLNRAASRAPLRLRFEDGGATLEPEASGADAAIARLLSIVYAAMADGTWSRLKACRNDACEWLFYDRSRNRSGHWCTMGACGNVMKARSYRRRRAGSRRP